MRKLCLFFKLSVFIVYACLYLEIVYLPGIFYLEIVYLRPKFYLEIVYLRIKSYLEIGKHLSKDP